MGRLSERERIIEILMIEHPERAPIARSTVSRLVSKYFATGTVKEVQRGGRTHVSEEMKLNVLLEVEENPHCSTRQIGLNNNIDHSTVVKLLKKEKCHPYKVHLLHELNEDDPDRRLDFCEEIMFRCDGEEIPTF
ncbi:hypothetical protein NQ315_006674 [Exocentrus adspersus]|uniref:Transposase n=1 Tax=Exocentrus adspersus TaxID=1586481 RepID=A0AAV8WC84_9CUCU|nr:hypothetical protein NQ315_006674 [Exocentrus adspersus]